MAEFDDALEALSGAAHAAYANLIGHAGLVSYFQEASPLEEISLLNIGSRPARRFPRPTLVFNLHAQFETLREEGKYERMRERILERDVELAGSINPMLSRHGDASEARQYSGRVIEKGWQCPFRDKRLEEAA